MERNVAVVVEAAVGVASFSILISAFGGKPIWLLTQLSPPGVLIFAAIEGDQSWAAAVRVSRASNLAGLIRESVLGR